MSGDEFSNGIEIISINAKSFGLILGSRALDFSKGLARLAFEKNVEIGGRRQMRTPTFEFSREYIEDLPGTPSYQRALVIFLESLSIRLNHPQRQQFLTALGIPINLEIHWPFRAVQTSDDYFVHVLARVGSPWSYEANFSVLLSGFDKSRVGPSLSPPLLEKHVINTIRTAFDKNLADFYPIGQHPATLQQVRIDLSEPRKPASDSAVKDYLKRKVYWLGFREGDERTQIGIADPYDLAYLGQTAQRLKQLARIIQANGDIDLDTSGQFAHATIKLLQKSDSFESEFETLLDTTSIATESTRDNHPSNVEKDAPTVFISYSTEDSHFARSLSKALKERSIGVWLDQHEIRVGDSLTKRIGQALNDQDFMIVILSPASVRSPWVQTELAEAMTREIRQKKVVVLPVIYRQCEIPSFLTDKKYADFTADSDAAFTLLVNSIEKHHASSPL